MFVSDILSQKGSQVFTVSAQTSVAEVSRELAEKRVGALVVQGDRHEMVGIVSERDVVCALAQIGAEAVKLVAARVMTHDVVTCDPDDTIDHVMGLMTRGRVRHLPVVRRGEVLGIVSIGDIVKARLEEVHHETEALRAYIVTS